jgi:hypothetical protein
MNWLSKFRYRHVGTLEGRCTLVREDGTQTGIERRCYWTLLENGFGQRRSLLSGRNPETPQSNHALAMVRAWLHGGAAPVGLDTSAAPAGREEPKRKKPALTVVPFQRGGE